jgi:leader peptidase (prepilin peptidase)/N-methyltransferase
VELLTGVFFVLSYLAAAGYLPGIAASGDTISDFDTLARAIKLCVFSFLLLGLIFTDAETQLLPDLLTKPGIALGIVFSLFVTLPGFAIPAIDNWRVVSLINSLAGAIMGAAVILGIALLYEAIRGVEGMGRGDVKLMALIGAFLGGVLTLLVLLLGSVIGSLFGVFLILWVWLKRLARRRKRKSAEPAAVSRSRAWQSATLVVRSFPIPFGVFLGMAALFAVFWGNSLIHWYAQFYR